MKRKRTTISDPLGRCSEIGNTVEPLFDFLANEIEPIVNSKKAEIDMKIQQIRAENGE